MILIFFGPPGAGKGTQAKLISELLKIPHLSTGVILRNRLLKRDSLSKKLKSTMETGELVSDTILNKIVLERVNNIDCEKGFILDGYPRTMEQVKFLNSILNTQNKKINIVFDIQVSNEIIFERIKSRSFIEKRKDDKEDILKTRIAKYLEETKPLSEFYQSNRLVNFQTINGNQDLKKVNSNIVKII